MSRNSFGEKKKVSVFSVIEVIVIIIMAAMIACMVFCNVVFHDENKASSIFGFSFYKTRAVNMVPEIPVNTVIIAKKAEIKERSVILCTIGEYTALTRVVETGQDEAGKTYYIVKFDTSPANETCRVESDAVIAKAVWQLESFGKLLDFATSVPGIIIAVIIPLLFIIIFQVMRIKNIRELEREASSIDDIDDIIVASKTENPPPVTFTEPKFNEDVTGKLPPVGRYLRDEEKPKAKLTVDANGRADYKVEKTEPIPREDAPFIRLEGFSAETAKQPAAVGAKPAPAGDGVYLNRPTKIEQRPSSDEFFPSPASQESKAAAVPAGKDEKVTFTPHLSNVIPESLANIQEAAQTNARPSFNDSVNAYFEKNSKPETKTAVPGKTDIPTIPEKAVIPKETIAPVKKKKNSKTLEELMSIIDSEENKLKK